MTFSPIRLLKWSFTFLISGALLLFVTGKVLSYYATRQLHEKIKTLGGTFESLSINVFTQRLTVENLQLKFGSDTLPSSTSKFNLQHLVCSNISFYKYVVHRRLEIDEILILNSDIVIDKNILKKDSAASADIALQSVFVNRVIVENASAEVKDDTVTEWSATFNFTLHKVKSSHLTELRSYTINDIKAKVRNLTINHAKGLYTTRVRSIDANSVNKTIEVDSLLLIPQHPKYKFARAVGKQIDRLNVFIKKIQVSGLHYNQFQDSAFVASKIDITSGEVYSFRDKRMPFREKKNKPLPMQALKELPIAVEVDTIQITNSKITYEEFPPEGFNSGKVTFENLAATFTNVSNRIYYNKSKTTMLQARADLMGKGRIQASFTLPIKEDTPYHAEGTITNLNLQRLNPALENLAFISIESGRLNEMAFNFDYNNDFSNGMLTVNYEDLKIKGLKKEKSFNISDLKTFLINIIVKDDKNSNVPSEKRTGTIAFARDKKRQIFNYWWKSLFSGIKGGVLDDGNKK